MNTFYLSIHFLLGGREDCSELQRGTQAVEGGRGLQRGAQAKVRQRRSIEDIWNFFIYSQGGA